jgi:hypothetical protein
LFLRGGNVAVLRVDRGRFGFVKAATKIFFIIRQVGLNAKKAQGFEKLIEVSVSQKISFWLHFYANATGGLLA